VIHGCVRSIGDRSLTACYTMTKLPDKNLAAVMEAVSVQFDLNARRAVALLPEIRAGAESLLVTA